ADLDYKNVALDDLVSMRIHGVSIDFVREMRELGYHPSVDKLVEMRIHGVSPSMVRALNKDG
ncbi:MAG TPA: hypothetical protein VKP65_11015, partial [Rhodothermales bacterium]|nr:hypothetical protein [Rhodothermales bacterium]